VNDIRIGHEPIGAEHTATADSAHDPAPIAHPDYRAIARGEKTSLFESVSSRCQPTSSRKAALDGSDLLWSTFLGGSGRDYVRVLKKLPSGSLVIAGHTASTNFPVTGGAFDETFNGGNYDAFVAAIAPGGGSIIWCTYLGGSIDAGTVTESVRSLACDQDGNIVVTGLTASSDFPVTSSAFDVSYNGGLSDVFVSKLSADGGALLWSTFIGGSAWDVASAVECDADNNVVVVGHSESTNFPTTVGVFDPVFNGIGDAFVTKIGSSGGNLMWSTYLGGSGSDEAIDLALDGSGNITVTGSTWSYDFPTTAGVYDRSHNGTSDAYVSKLSAVGSTLLWSTFLGGTGTDGGTGIVVDDAGAIFLYGRAGLGFPTTENAYCRTYSGGPTDICVAKMSSNASALIWSTLLGGENWDRVQSGALNEAGGLILSGGTTSHNYPCTENAYDTSFAGGMDVFISAVSTDGGSLPYSSLIGGVGGDEANCMVRDSNDNYLLSGYTSSVEYPVTDDALDNVHNGYDDAFITCFHIPPPPIPEQWPSCADAPCLRFRVEEAIPGAVHSVRLSCDLPTSTKSQTPIPIVNGFAVVGRDAIDRAVDLLNAIDSIELLDASTPANVIGHIGFRYSESDLLAGRSADAYLFLHNDEPPMGNWNPYFVNGWQYYAEGEYPVSMLVPPHASMGTVQGGSRVPVVLVHGAGAYYPRFEMVPESLYEYGYEAWFLGYPYDQPIESSSHLLARAIQNILGDGLYACPAYDASRVDIVAHSMGGLVTRQYIQSAEYADDVNKLAMLGTPNHGSHMSYRLYYRGFLTTVTNGEWRTHDPEAPAHEQMTPASDFLFALNSAPPRGLGTGDVARDYLVIAGVDNFSWPLGHEEIWHQDDNVVAVSSASLLEQGVPLIVVKKSHQDLAKASELSANLDVFLDDANYDPANPAFDDWIVCRMNEVPSNACSSVFGLDTQAGIMELHINGGATDARHYRVERGDQDLLDFRPNAFIGWKDSVTRVGDAGNRYFSTNTNNLNEIKWANIDEGTYRGRLLENRWVRLIPHWVPVGVSEPFSYTHMRTTMATLNFSAITNSIASTSNGTALMLVGKALSQYEFTVDASIDTLVFSLSSPVSIGDYGQHGLVLETPAGIIVDPTYAESAENVEFEDNGPAGFAQYLVASPETGTWHIRHNDGLQDPLLYVFLNTDISAQLSLERTTYVIGDTLVCHASLVGDGNCEDTQLSLTGYYVSPDSSIAQSIGAVILEDMGGGQYRGVVEGAIEGQYTFVLNATCFRSAGETIQRETSKGVLVSRPTNDLTDVHSDEGRGVPLLGSMGISAVAPNPFNPRTVISYRMPRAQRVSLCAFDISGRKVASIFEGNSEQGEHTLVWLGQDDSGRRLPSGVYFLRLEAAGVTHVQKIAILK
jgi:pimeloyl-ACP methyl ester carboxylesterase